MKLASRPALIALAVTVLMVASSFGVIGAGVLSGPSGTSVPQPAPTATPGIAAQAPGAAGAGALSSGKLTMSPFDQRVLETVHALTADGVPTDRIRVPYTGAPAQIVNGVVVPGDAVSGSPVTPYASDAPAPSGIAYYGESDPSGTIQTTTLDASSVVGSLSVNQLKTLYLDTDTPDQWGIQLNSVLTNVTLQGTRGYDFWTQNAVNYIQQNETLSFGEDTWNFSSPYSTVPTDNSTIASHNPNGSVAVGLYIGEGPFLFAPRPFNLTLYLNSSVTPAGDQELWFNYTLSTPGGHRTSSNYDWIVFNSTNPSHPATVGIAPFEASGTQLDPAGSPDDFELDYGIGAFDGATNDVLAANASAELDYCPIATASCSSSQFQSVPAAVDYGGETGETSSGLSFTYAGTSETATAGPFTLRGLWGYSGAAGSTPGSTPVVNQITVSGAPDSPTVMPYVFAFFRTSATPDTSFEWAPDVPLWHLAPGTYDYELMLADYQEKTGTIVVGVTPTVLSVALPYDRTVGVYTPLWAFNNSALAGISTSGDGTLSDQYALFNNTDAGCSTCGGATGGNLSAIFQAYNDWVFPVFVGVLLDGTNAYANLDQPVGFSVPTVDPYGDNPPNTVTDLQIEFVSTQHVTLSNDARAGGWPVYLQLTTLAGYVPSSQNPFPDANVVLWNSSHDLLRSNTFVPYPDCWGPTDLLLYGGTRNTIWGNTLENASGPTGSDGCYAGLAESESGDLIYNNNFSVENPTVYLPFDIYNDSCPDGYSGQCGPMTVANYVDTWNVTLQPASAVSATVNGFALSGDILGPACTLQGGNYWWDYGNALNPYGSLPFVNRYNYSDLAPDFPPSFSDVQSSITSGGDYLPLTHATCSTSITLSQGQGPVGADFMVRGTGFTLRSPATVSFNGGLLTPIACTKGTFVGTTITTTNAGAFRCTFAVPSEPKGFYSVVATNSATGTPTVAKTFKVTVPAIELTPHTGLPGSSYTVIGWGFNVRSGATVSFSNGVSFVLQTPTSCSVGTVSGSSITTNATGGFVCTFSVPALGHGEYAVVGTDRSTGAQTAEKFFKVA